MQAFSDLASLILESRINRFYLAPLFYVLVCWDWLASGLNPDINLIIR